MSSSSRLRIAFLLCAGVFLICPHKQSSAQPLFYDTDFSITYALAGKIVHGDGRVSMTFDFEIQNNTGGEARNVRLTMASPLLATANPGTVSAGDIGTRQTKPATGSYTFKEPGIDDLDFLRSLLWRVEFSDDSGLHHECYISGSM